MSTDYAIETEGLTKVYRPRFRGVSISAVSDVHLRVGRGTKFGLLGANGAGKTTFVKMLLAAVEPTRGKAALFGKDARHHESRRPVGYLPENHRFPTYLSGRSMLDFYGSLSGMDDRTRKSRIPELLELVGLTGWGDIRLRKYSKGMLQRLGLAQALMHKPQLLILDEPTDGVDPVGRRQIRDVLNGLRDKGVTIFLNSHLLSEVETFCDYVAILKKGKLALEGRISDLTTGRGYRVTALDVPEDLRRQLPEMSTQGATQQVQVGTREEANRVVDLLRGAGCLIDSVMPTQSTLEEVFIRTTEATAATQSGPA